MRQKRHTPEQIIGKLREAEVALAKGQPMVEVESIPDLVAILTALLEEGS